MTVNLRNFSKRAKRCNSVPLLSRLALEGGTQELNFSLCNSMDEPGEHYAK